jgi:hypothetical protein
MVAQNEQDWVDGAVGVADEALQEDDGGLRLSIQTL